MLYQEDMMDERMDGQIDKVENLSLLHLCICTSTHPSVTTALMDGRTDEWICWMTRQTTD